MRIHTGTHQFSLICCDLLNVLFGACNNTCDDIAVTAHVLGSCMADQVNAVFVRILVKRCCICIIDNRTDAMKSALLFLIVLTSALVLTCLIVTIITIARKRNLSLILVCLYLTALISVTGVLFCARQYQDIEATLQQQTQQTEPPTTTQPTTAPTTVPTTAPTTAPTTEPPTTEPPTEPDPTYTAESGTDSNPENWGITWDIMELGSIVESYNRQDPISLGEGNTYSTLDGVITFRGNNYRTGATFGTADITD